MKRSPLVRKTPMAQAGFARKAPANDAKPAKGPRPKKCANRACRAPYIPDPKQPFKNWCCEDCGTTLALEKLAKAKAAKAKAQRAEDRKAREKLKDRGDWLKEVERIFNEFIRLRDLAAGHGCISCGRHNAERWNAGHFKSVGAHPELRFDEDNVHLQCARPCNMDMGGNIHNYRLGLVARIGPERLARLEGPHAIRKWSIDELKALKAIYSEKVKALKKERSMLAA